MGDKAVSPHGQGTGGGGVEVTYRGYELRTGVYKPPCGPAHDSVMVYAGEKFMAYIANVALARRVIDAHTKAKIWPTLDEKQE